MTQADTATLGYLVRSLRGKERRAFDRMNELGKESKEIRPTTADWERTKYLQDVARTSYHCFREARLAAQECIRNALVG